MLIFDTFIVFVCLSVHFQKTEKLQAHWFLSNPGKWQVGKGLDSGLSPPSFIHTSFKFHFIRFHHRACHCFKKYIPANNKKFNFGKLFSPSTYTKLSVSKLILMINPL